MSEAWRELRTPVFVVCVALFVVHQLAEWVHGSLHPLVDGFLDPLLSIPILLGLAEAEQRWLLRKQAWAGYTAVEVSAMVTALALLFEFGFPRLDPARQTYDPLDFLAYAVGGGIYWLGVRRSVSAISEDAGGVSESGFTGFEDEG